LQETETRDYDATHKNSQPKSARERKKAKAKKMKAG
jgi:hypothetical protein